MIPIEILQVAACIWFAFVAIRAKAKNRHLVIENEQLKLENANLSGALLGSGDDLQRQIEQPEFRRRTTHRGMS